MDARERRIRNIIDTVFRNPTLRSRRALASEAVEGGASAGSVGPQLASAAYTIYVKARGRFASFLQMGCGHPLSPLQAVCEQPVSVAILGQASAQTILSSLKVEPILI